MPMPWNWELPDWPKFQYNADRLSNLERQFLLGIGGELAYLTTIGQEERNRFVVEILSMEGEKSSKIEGEILEREGLQSSIKRHFGLSSPSKKTGGKEHGIAELLCSVYESFQTPLSHELLWQWHALLLSGSSHILQPGQYRTGDEPMQIVSQRYGHPRVYFEVPPSAMVMAEMSAFIEWFNTDSTSLPILARAAIAHVYFESIHPFDDGNGRIGRILAEKVFSQGVGRPALIAVSRVLEKRRKEYYEALGRCNRTMDAQPWAEFFAEAAVQAQEGSVGSLRFLIEKSKLLSALSSQLNERQTKILLRMFHEGPSGLRGGLSAEKYIAITRASRATATRDLSDLVERGALTKTGELRHTRYYLNILLNHSSLE
jgi:Fic family protein